MSIELPKYTILQESNKPQKITLPTLAGLLIAGCILGYFASILLSKNTNKNLIKQNEVLEDSNAKNQDRIISNETQISLLKTEQKVQRQAAIELQKDYKELIDKNNGLSSEIKFYESLLSPNSKNKGLRVFSAKITRNSNDKYVIKVVVVQKIEKAREISGNYKVLVLGKKGGKAETIVVSTEKSKYKFKYFQNISYEFLLPKSFIPEQLVVELFPKTKKAKNVKYSTQWLIEKK